MITTAVNQKKAMAMLMTNSEATHVHHALDNDGWAAIEAVIPTLEVFASATEVFSLQSYANMHTVGEIYSGVINFLDGIPTDATKAMIAKLQEYRNKLPKEHWLAEILNPNCKVDSRDTYATQKISLLKKHAQAYANSNPQASATNVPQLPPATPKSRQKKSAIEKFRSLVQPTESVVNKSDLNTEVERYIMGPTAGGNIDPCSWWKTNESEYPILAMVARDWLAVPASSVPCEQLFSLAGNTVTKTRNCLAPETAEALLCLKSWWIYEGAV